MKYTFIFILVFITQLTFILMWGEYVWLFKYANGGVGGTILNQVNPIFWVLLVLECVAFLIFIGLCKKRRGSAE